MTKIKPIQIQPRKNYVLVRQDEESRITECGLVIPSDVEQEKKSFGEVIAVGQGIEDVKKGNRVVFGTYAGEQVKMKEKGKEIDYRLLHDDDVIAILK